MTLSEMRAVLARLGFVPRTNYEFALEKEVIPGKVSIVFCFDPERQENPTLSVWFDDPEQTLNRNYREMLKEATYGSYKIDGDTTADGSFYALDFTDWQNPAFACVFDSMLTALEGMLLEYSTKL
jgi:hypothetical protein